MEVGASSYWSELLQIQTADNLFSKGIITDAVSYLESIPDKYIANKKQLLEDIKIKAGKQIDNMTDNTQNNIKQKSLSESKLAQMFGISQ